MNTKNKYSIKENLVHPVLFSSIRDTLTGDTFYWFYNDFVNYRPCEGYKFTNEIVKNSNLTSSVFINYLNMVRFNLFLKTPTPQKYVIDNHKKDSKIGILFANTCDGGIEIDNNFIEAEENKLVLFDSSTEYKVVTSTKNKIFTYTLINYE